MPIYGVKSKLGLTFQTSFDTMADITNSHINIPYLSETLTTNLEDILSEQIEGVFDEKERYRGKQHVSGDIEVEVGAKSIGMLLASMFDKTSTVTSDSIYTHTFLPIQSEETTNSWHWPLTINKGSNDGNAQNFYNLCATSAEFSLEQGGFLKAKFSYVGGINNNTTTDPADNYNSNDELFTWDASTFFLANPTWSQKLTSMTINVTEPIEPQFTLANSYWPRSNNLNGFRDVTFNFTMPWNNNSDYTYFFNTTSSAQISLECFGHSEIQSGYTNKIVFDMYNCMYESFEASASGPGEVELNISGRAQYNTTQATAIKIELTNLLDGTIYKT